MALILKDRVKESSTSSGTGSITLGGAFPGYQTFNAAIATGSTVYYTIHNLAAGFDTEWEVGVGTFTSPATLSRDTVLSSATGSKINFTSGTGGLEVFITQPAEQALYTNQATGIVESSGNGANTIAFTNINASNVVMVSGTISTNAANATDITNKTYVDGLFSTGISYHEPVLVESPIALNALYNQPGGAGNGVGATLTNNGANAALVIDGVTLSNTARVLVYQQSNAVQNGVYTVTNPGNVSAQWVLTRSTDADTFGLASPNKLGQGDAFFVQDGDTGAGETYICNTSGTITFGSSNITFAQISSSQIYAAGTGLNLSNLTFSIANTTVVSGLYGDSATVPVIEINAQGQLTSAANSAINVSSITVGTLPNARTTAASANGASTIVARDANGSFAANVVTATTGNFTNITANAAGLTDINASNITSGTISNARTTGNTANSASTIVLRDANGAFTAGNVTAANFIGAGTTITSINASNISSGTIDNSRTTAASANGASTIVSRDSSGSFSAGSITATSISGNGVALSAINASNITSGTIDNARTSAATANGASTIVLRDSTGSFAAGVITANGSALSAINASSISSGTVATARLASGTANSSTYLRGDSTWAALSAPNNGTLSMGVSGTGLSGSATFTADQSSNSTFTVTINSASANGASTVVARDASGNFAAGTITATLTGTASALVTGNSYQVGSFGVGTAASGTSGEIRATNNITAYYSDDRMKTNLGNIPDALAKLKTLNGFYYEANDIAQAMGYDVKKEVGVSAQQVQAIMPEVVAPAPIDDKYLTVRYERLVPLLIEAIKELEAQVAELKAKGN
jgi:hypothetical protein